MQTTLSEQELLRRQKLEDMSEFNLKNWTTSRRLVVGEEEYSDTARNKVKQGSGSNYTHKLKMNN